MPCNSQKIAAINIAAKDFILFFIKKRHVYIKSPSI